MNVDSRRKYTIDEEQEDYDDEKGETNY